MKKILLFGLAGMLTTATIVYATVAAEKKTKKEVVVKKDNKCDRTSKHHCVL